MTLSRIVILLMGLSLVACASHEPKPPKTQELFSTLIRQDGTKLFSYALVLEQKEGGKPRGDLGGHGGRHHHGGGAHGEHKSNGDNPVDDRLDAMFENSLNSKINDTGFCRQGFKQYDRKNLRGAIQISGECNEPANDEDKSKFPNPPPKKVIVETIE